MATITFDTHTFVHRLEAAGFAAGQADAMPYALRELSSEAELATKRDLREMEIRLESRIEKTAFDLKVDFIKWVTGALIAQAAVIATLVRLR